MDSRLFVLLKFQGQHAPAPPPNSKLQGPAPHATLLPVALMRDQIPDSDLRLPLIFCVGQISSDPPRSTLTAQSRTPAHDSASFFRRVFILLRFSAPTHTVCGRQRFQGSLLLAMCRFLIPTSPWRLVTANPTAHHVNTRRLHFQEVWTPRPEETT